MSRDMLLLRVCCPYCESPLTEGRKVHLDAYVRDTNQKGRVHLSAIFGDHAAETDLVVPDGAIAEFQCPSCDQSLMLQVPCKLCGAPMASINIQSGGVVEFCSRKGCRGHALGGFGDVDQMMSLINSMLKTPHD